MQEELTVEVAVVQGPVEAEVVRAILESNGIVVLTSTLVPHSVWPLTVDGLGSVRIRVREEEAERARELLARHRQAGLAAVDADGEPRAPRAEVSSPSSAGGED